MPSDPLRHQSIVCSRGHTVSFEDASGPTVPFLYMVIDSGEGILNGDSGTMHVHLTPSQAARIATRLHEWVEDQEANSAAL